MKKILLGLTIAGASALALVVVSLIQHDVNSPVIASPANFVSELKKPQKAVPKNTIPPKAKSVSRQSAEVSFIEETETLQEPPRVFAESPMANEAESEWNNNAQPPKLNIPAGTPQNTPKQQIVNNITIFSGVSSGYTPPDKSTRPTVPAPSEYISPAGTISINSGAQYSNATTVALTLSAADTGSGMGAGAQMQFSNDTATWSTPENYATTKTWSLSAGDGEKTVYVKYKDVAGNWSDAYSASIVLDTAAPVMTVDPIPSLVTQDVTLAYTFTDNLTPTESIIVTGDNSPYKTEGLHDVTLTAKDLAGNSATAQASFTIDKNTPPAGTIAINSGAQYTNIATVTLTLSAADTGSGMGPGAQMQFSNDAATWSTPENYSTAKSWPLVAGEGAKTVYVKYKDAAGNWSNIYSAGVTLDTTVPVITVNPVTSPTNQNVALSYSASDNFTPIADITITGDRSPYTTEGVHEVTLTAKDLAGNSATAQVSFTLDTTAPVITINPVTSPTNQNVVLSYSASDNFTPIADITVTGDSSPYTTEGTHDVTLTAMDLAGNSATAHASFTVDTTPPSTGAITINSGALYTNAAPVVLTLSATDAGIGMGVGAQIQLSNDNATWTAAENYATAKSWSLGAGDGAKTVYVKYKDAAGNWSDAYSAGITLDTTAPVITINPVTSPTNQNVVLSYSASDNFTPIADITVTGDSSPYTTEGTHDVTLTATDLAGNSATAHASFTVDTTPPSTGAITINSGALYTNAAPVTLTLSAADAGSGIVPGAQIQLSNDATNWSAPEDYATTKTWSLSGGDGAKTVYVKYKDAAGNWSDAYSADITLDTTAPVITLDPVSSLVNHDVTLSYTVSDNSTPTVSIVVTGDSSPYTTEGAHDVTLTATDLAGNSATAQANFTIDKTAPVVIITSPQNGSVADDTPVKLDGTVDGVAFSESRELNHGENTLTKIATDAAGNTGSASVKVNLFGEVIDSNGGEVASEDGSARMVIPQGALTSPTRITLLKIDNDTLQQAAPSERPLLSAVECRPNGLVFASPVEIVYTLDQAEIPGTPVELGLYNETLNQILPSGQTSVVPVDGYTVSFPISHFSTYAVLGGLTPQSTPIGAGVKIPLPDLLTGAFSHDIPITVPPGRKGMQPGIGLSYRSSNSNSWVGLGFSLNPGYIVRSTRLGPPTYNDTKDTFYFITEAGTIELLNLIDNLYQAKVESGFIKFFKEPDDSWRVVAKDGSVMRFGQDSNAKEVSISGTFVWYLTRATDTNGNYIAYQYAKDQGKSYLFQIDYTGNDNGFLPTHSVEFILEARDDISSSYISTSKIVTAKRLKEILVRVSGDLVWRYALEYNYSPDTGRSLLKSVTQYASDDKALPTQILTYQQAKNE